MFLYSNKQNYPIIITKYPPHLFDCCFIPAIAEALNCKISVVRDKKSVLDCLDDPELSSRVSLRWQDSGLHVLPMGKLNYKVGSYRFIY